MLLTTKEPRLIPYQTVRQAIGWMGILLPLALIVGNRMFGHCSVIQSSISHYYYTATGHWLTGILCAVAMFLISYKGYNRIDAIVSSLAGFAAVLIAFFPTNMHTLVPEEIILNKCVLFSLPENSVRNAIHYASAGLFFSLLAGMSLFLFTKSRGAKTRAKVLRNRVFRTCGIIILVAVVSIGIYGLLANSGRWERYKPVFWLEWMALMAFGVSWLVKGGIVFKDDRLEDGQE